MNSSGVNVNTGYIMQLGGNNCFMRFLTVNMKCATSERCFFVCLCVFFLWDQDCDIFVFLYLCFSVSAVVWCPPLWRLVLLIPVRKIQGLVPWNQTWNHCLIWLMMLCYKMCTHRCSVRVAALLFPVCLSFLYPGDTESSLDSVEVWGAALITLWNMDHYLLEFSILREW